MTPKWISVGLILLLCLCQLGSARKYHVSQSGHDINNGSASSPFKTISAAAKVAQPGDVITVHEGVYRERINPPRGGTSEDQRIVYQAASAEKVVIKGSEEVKGWQKIQNDTWRVTVPNRLFGDFNPYQDLIHGDWFNPLGRAHHTGAVYLNDHWLTEAATLDDVMTPIGDAASAYMPGSQGTLLNVAWLRPGQRTGQSGRIQAENFAAQRGIKTAPCTEGGQCVGWIEQGDWMRYEQVDFGQGIDRMEIRAASATRGGVIEIRLDAPDGDLLGTCAVPNTGGWQSWSSFHAKIKPVSGVKTICLTFRASQSERAPEFRLWFAKVGSTDTTVWAQFKGVNPNDAQVEMNVRQTVFYPEKTGVNYITVRGFTLMHAATPWAPPTAEQIGLIGTHWSKGWIIENNDIRYSVCTGVTLGKHGDKYDNTSANSAEGYVKTIERATAQGWSKANIGHHRVRHNRISHCEQAGIVGSMGPVFSTVTDNTIHDIHIRRLFTGAEMAGIKFHGAVDTTISRNHIYRTCRGIWLDWMTQGTHVTGNLLHDNGPSEDLFVEVNHGPFLVDNNIFLSSIGLLVNSQGGAYVHNLITGQVRVLTGEGRHTPYLKAHSTEVAGLHANPSGDERFYNNIFVKTGLGAYDPAQLPVFMAGNVFLHGAKPSKHEQDPLVLPEVDPEITLVDTSDGVYLHMKLDKAWVQQPRQLVTTDLLGKASTPDLPYEQSDGSPYRIDTDYLGRQRNEANPCVGPFECSGQDGLRLKVSRPVAQTALDRYVHEPDPAYHYECVKTETSEHGTTDIIKMTSQSWLTEKEVQQTLWWHWLIINRPKQVSSDTALLFIGGGSNRDDTLPGVDQAMARIATATQSVVIQLKQVPNQPLIFHGDGVERVEDDLIAYGWDQFLRGGRDEWLARLPMTKSAVRAMDTVSEFLAKPEQGGLKLDKYVVAGGSKRGWTTWTTGIVDKRVVAIAPIVIDMLNCVPSFKHHWEAYGFYAPAVGNYVEHGIMEWQDTTEYQSLSRIVEPYEYRDRLTLPKLMINATGDQFFMPDSHRFFFDELKGPKYIRYVPNADHSLDDTDATETLAAWQYAISNQKQLPQFDWKIDWTHGTISVQFEDRPKEIRLWQATNPEARDFRLETLGKVWTSRKLSADADGRVAARVTKPDKGWTAFLVELTYVIDGAPTAFKVTSGVAVVPDVLPFAGKRPKGHPTR